MPDGAATAHLYHPKLFTTFMEGYGWATLRADALAGLTVAVVALPLSMAIAVASGVSPERGLYAAIIGGFFVSALGGSRVQVGGPAGAFIVLVAGTVAKYGVDGLMVIVMMSGVFLALIGLSGLGSLIRYIPHAVTVGFTCGIAVTIGASQLHDFAGLALSGPEPGPLLPKLIALSHALPTISPSALLVGVGSSAVIFALRYWRPLWPGMLIAVALASLIAAVCHLSVETIGGRFGALPSGMPLPHFPRTTLRHLWELLPSALSFTLLGGIESLLSAKVADSMTGRKHRSNMELVAQGIANIASALFGGLSVTGTIARTATNIRAGARTPIAGMLHSAFVLCFLLIAASLAAFIPLASLAGLLIVVCWNMAERKAFVESLKDPCAAIVLLCTFVLTIAVGLATGVAAGCIAAWLLYLARKRSAGRTRQ
jgi:SulP family sulfate permease